MQTDAERIKELETKIKLYELNGAARLFYALNKKLNEMADMLNKQSLTTLDLTDAKDKTFERLKVIWNDASGLATAVQTLGQIAGITNDEMKDIASPKYRITTPESIADGIGNPAGQRN